MARRTRSKLRIVSICAGVAALAALAWAVAPAISLERFAPEPVNFSQQIPEVERLARRDGRVRFASDVIEAPKRFDLVGLPEADEHVELRARESGGEWSPWVETNDAEPIWTGGSDELQLRSHGERPAGEIAYVNVSGDATGADRLLNGLRGIANSAFISAASLAAPVTAEADAPFEVVNRTEWDPGHDCVPREPAYGTVKAGVVHHTVNANDYTTVEAPSVVLAICRYHRYSHGWNDIGYNALVDRFGNVYAGRTGGLTNAVIGAHTAGFNSQTFGVASIGDHTESGLSHAAIEGITNLLAWKLSLHGIDAVGKSTVVSAGGSGNRFPSGDRVKTKQVTRHRRFNETACPGKAQIKKILRLTQEKIASGTFTPPPTAPPADGGVPAE
jgi:hypothetical protein